jgi:DUF1680 family protein
MTFNHQKIVLAVIISVGISPAFAQLKDYPIQPVAFTSVHVHDHFWQPRMEVNASVTIPYILQKCKEYGRIDNFLRAAKLMPGDKLTEYTFDDTDVYKVIEGASYAMQVKKNPLLERRIDSLITIIGAAQEKDGYLYTFRTINPAKPHPWVGTKRWEKEEDLSHELYNSGHLFEAAVAHYQATGKRTLLNIAIKNANLLVHDFGYGKEEKYPGHQIVEIGLVKYLDLAKFFLDVRGPGGSEYNQAAQRVVDQHQAAGHAVRATYMYTGMADIAAITGDKTYLKAIDDIWNDVAGSKIYLTGGIGATNSGEAFGSSYQLPNMSAYAETCAAIANVYWNSRMFQLHGDSKYIDILERTLYNGLLSGISLSGNRFFYPNPLASMGQHQRSAWFSCACCISNMTRFLASVSGYVYAQNNNDLYVNLFMSNTASIKLISTSVTIAQTTEYPWKGTVNFTITPTKPATFAVKIRVPGWARQQPIPGNLYSYMDKYTLPVTITLNGKPVPYQLQKGYLVLNREWTKGDKIRMILPIKTQKVAANPQVKDDNGKFAFQRGPLVYCLEGPDNKDSLVQNILIDSNSMSTVTYRPQLLNGVYTIGTTGKSVRRQLNSDALTETTQEITAIPYYAWANRGPGEMMVWIPYKPSAALPKPAATIASTSKVSSSLKNERMNKALQDQLEPVDSKDANYPYLHWWPKKNSTEFVAYTFREESTVSESKVYWFDDGPWGGCRIPDSYTLYYKKGTEWVPVKPVNGYSIAKDKYNILQFEPVKTTAIRMEIKLPADNSAGIHEWVIK